MIKINIKQHLCRYGSENPEQFLILFSFIHVPALHWWNLWLYLFKHFDFAGKKRKRRKSMTTSMLSSQLVHGLSGRCMNSIVDAQAAFLMQPYCHLLRWGETTPLFALCIFCTVLFFLSFIFLFVRYSSFICEYWTTCCVHYRQQSSNGAGKRGFVCVFYWMFWMWTQRTFLPGPAASCDWVAGWFVFDIHTVSCRVDISHCGPIIHIAHTHTQTYLTSPILTVAPQHLALS